MHIVYKDIWSKVKNGNGSTVLYILEFNLFNSKLNYWLILGKLMFLIGIVVLSASYR